MSCHLLGRLMITVNYRKMKRPKRKEREEEDRLLREVRDEQIYRDLGIIVSVRKEGAVKAETEKLAAELWILDYHRSYDFFQRIDKQKRPSGVY